MSVQPERLKDFALFKDFTSTGLGILAGIATEKVGLTGQPLFVEGNPSSALYFLVEGRVKVSIKAPDGTVLPIAALEAGETLGELSLLGSSTHFATATFDADSKVIELKVEDFQKLQREKPQACLKLIMAVATEFGRKVSDNRDTLRSLMARAAGR